MVDWHLKRVLREETLTVKDMGWNGIQNGRLLKLVAAEFDVMITTDKSFSHQQHLPGVDLAVILLRANSNKAVDLLPLFPEVQKLLDLVQPGRVYVLGQPPSRRRSR